MNLYDVYSLFQVTPVKGQGSYIYDDKGTRYLDFYGGHAVISIGHSHPHYIKKITSQLENLGFYSNSVVNPLQQELADKLEKTSGLSGYELFLINSGAEANENALKLASFYNKRKSVLALTNGFHGRTSAAINITHTGLKHKAEINNGISPTFCDYDKVDDIILQLKTGKHTAIIIEFIQGVGGLDMITDDALQKIRKVCTVTDTILIMDEVQSGYGRSGEFFAFQSAGIKPDIITMAKGMGNGFPIGGILVNAKKIPAMKSRLGTTYGGNHLACSAGIAVLDVIEKEQLIKNSSILGQSLRQELEELNYVKKIKGRGLMLGAEFEFPVKELRKNLVFNHQLFTGSSSNPNLLRLLPPLNISNMEVELFLSKLKNALQKI